MIVGGIDQLFSSQHAALLQVWGLTSKVRSGLNTGRCLVFERGSIRVWRGMDAKILSHEAGFMRCVDEDDEGRLLIQLARGGPLLIQLASSLKRENMDDG